MVWWICYFDLHALFSGAGTGEFVHAMLANDMTPASNCQLYPVGLNGCSVIYPEEQSTLPTILQLNHDVFIHAVRLALLGAECRRDMLSQTYLDGSIGYASIGRADQEKRLFSIQQSLTRLWESPHVGMLEQQAHQLPRRSKELFQQVSSTSKPFGLCAALLRKFPANFYI